MLLKRVLLTNLYIACAMYKDRSDLENTEIV